MKKYFLSPAGNSKVSAVKISLYYFVFAALWIFFSDTFVGRLNIAPADLPEVQIFKGWFFVIVTSYLLYRLVVTAINKVEKSESKLINSLEYNRTLFENSIIGLALTSLDGRLVDVNSSFAKIIGYTIAETLNLTYWQITPSKYSEQEQEQLKLLNSIGHYGPYEKEYIHKDGHLVPVRLQGLLLDRDGEKFIWSSVEDISLEKRAKMDLEISHNRLLNTLETMNDGFVSLDKNWCYTYMNRRAGEIFGRDPAKMIGKHIWTEFPEGIDQPFYRNYIKAVESQKPIKIEEYYAPYDKWFENRIFPSSEGLSIFFQDITERKLYEDQLRKWEHIFQYSGWGVVLTDPATNSLIAVNPACAKMYGYSVEEILGKQLSYFYAPDKKLEINEQIEVVNKQGINSYESVHMRKDGSLFPVLITVTAFKDHKGKILYRAANIIDITERRLAEETALKNEKKYRFLFEYNPMPMWIYSLETLAFLEVNNAAVDHYGYSRDEFLKMTLKDIRPEEDVELLLDNVSKTIDTLSRAGIWRHKKKNGEIIFVEITSHLVDYENKSARLVLANNVTERTLAQAEITRLNEELEQRVKLRTSELEEAYKELEAFSYSVSHDLRVPLRSMNGYSQVLIEDYYDKLDNPGKEYLNKIRSSSQKMAILIDDILNLAKLSRSSIKPVKVDLSSIANSVASILTEIDFKRTAEVIIEPGLIDIADPTLIKLVVQNLLENAWKFTQKVPHARIEFGKTIIDGVKTYFVRDNGAGFNMDYSKKLFKPFQRLHNPSEFSGTGIGLASVQRIIQRHKGKVWAESKVDEGTTIYFTINS